MRGVVTNRTHYFWWMDSLKLLPTLMARLPFASNYIGQLPCINGTTDSITFTEPLLHLGFRKPVVAIVCESIQVKVAIGKNRRYGKYHPPTQYLQCRTSMTLPIELCLSEFLQGADSCADIPTDEFSSSNLHHRAISTPRYDAVKTLIPDLSILNEETASF